jgi:hypothetical protein
MVLRCLPCKSKFQIDQNRSTFTLNMQASATNMMDMVLAQMKQGWLYGKKICFIR